MTAIDIVDAEVVEDMTTEAITPRQQHIAELRQLLTMLELHPEVPMPYSFGDTKWSPVTWFSRNVQDAAATQRAIGGLWSKNDPNASDYDAESMVLTRVLDREAWVKIVVSREKVCEKTVVGTEKKKVRKLVSEAVYEEVYEDVDKIELKCGSLLSAADAEALEKL